MSEIALLHVEHPEGTLMWIALDLISENPHQPRTTFSEEELAQLADSIRIHGVLQPVLVVEAVGGRYTLVAGERRWRAARLAGLGMIPAVVRQSADSRLQALAENIDRVDLNPVEEGEAYLQLMADRGWTQEEVAAAVHRSRARVSHAVAITRLPEKARNRVAAGVLSFGHARVLCGIRDPYVAAEFADIIVREGLTVRQAEERVALGQLPGWELERPRKQRARRSARTNMEAASALSELLETRVQVTAGPKRGKIVIDFAGEDDLTRILDILKG